MPLFFALFSGNWTRKGANMNDETLRVYLKNNCYGKSHLIAGNTLEQQLHINGSDLRKRINRLRRKGVPIASSREGYFCGHGGRGLRYHPPSAGDDRRIGGCHLWAGDSAGVLWRER